MRLTAIGSLSRPRLIAVALGVVLVVLAALSAAALIGGRPAAGAGGGGGCLSATPACTFKNHMAQADFGTLSSDGCTFVDASVQPFESLTVPGRQTGSAVFVQIFSFNACTGSVVFSYSNFDPNTFGADFTGSLQFSSADLSSASVNGTATMFDDFTGQQAFTSTVDVTWQAYGPKSSFINGFHFRAPGFVVNGHDVGVSRGATAQGTLTDGGGNNMAATPTLAASLENDTSGTVFIGKP